MLQRRFHYFDWKESTELEDNSDEFPLILTTSRVLQHYNASTMTRRTANEELVSEDILLINARDAADKGIQSGDTAKLFSKRGEVFLTAEISEKVKPGIVFKQCHQRHRR